MCGAAASAIRARANTVVVCFSPMQLRFQSAVHAKLLVFNTSASHGDQLASCLDPAAVAPEHNLFATRVKGPKQNGQRSELSLA